MIKVNHETEVVHDGDNLQPQCNADVDSPTMQPLQDQDLAYYIRVGYDTCDHCWPIKTGSKRR